jgi:ATP synthase protein I
MEIYVKDSRKDVTDLLLKYGSLGIEMGLCVVIGILVGQFLDKHFNTTPYLTIVFLLFGIAAAFKTIFSLIKKVEKENERDDHNRH